MPDITMCMNEDCPLKKQCYRHEASGTKPNPWRQSYSVFGWNAKGPSVDCYTPIRAAAAIGRDAKEDGNG